jgi:methionyl-tRNA formyltransferase
MQSLGQSTRQSGTISQIILLTGRTEAPFLTEILRLHNPALDVVAVETITDLEAACGRSGPGTRLISFCTSVIVPERLLSALPGPSYNFHPGPPERPGRYPAVFALYDKAERFGVTAHEMRARVDSGPIVAAEWFNIPMDCTLDTLEERTFAELVQVFKWLAPHLATKPEPLTHKFYKWSGRKTTKAECYALASITPDMEPAEVALRKRACGIYVVLSQVPQP